MTTSRKQFLRDTGWASAGAVFGTLGSRLLVPGWAAEVGHRVMPWSRMPSNSPTSVSSTDESQGDESFSQAGEDMIVRFFLRYRQIAEMTYLDVGANDPIELSNTYYFYLRGFRGVLVEPNVSLCDRLRAVRPEDTTLAAGIGVGGGTEADYYVMNFHGLNTFSKEEAEHQVEASEGRISIKEVLKMPLRDINEVMSRHFKGAPTFLSVDTEGMDLAILKSIDFTRYRPKVICAETLVSSTTKTRPEITEFMAAQNYVARGGSFVNTIFVDSAIL